MYTPEPTLIDQYRQLHAQRPYGRGGGRYRRVIETLIDDVAATTILDYGCGQTRLGDHINRPSCAVLYYDPAIPGLDARPAEAVDLVVCTDVLEHIPAAEIPALLADIRAHSARAFFTISTRPASTILPDGRNAHLTCWAPRTWRRVIGEHFPEARILSYDPRERACAISTFRPARPWRVMGQLKAVEARRWKARLKQKLRRFARRY